MRYLLVLVLTACGAPVHIEPEAPGPLQEAVDRAQDRWFAACGVELDFEPNVGLAPAPLKCGRVRGVWGCAGDDWIQISEAVPTDMVETVLVHEIGHLLEAPDTSGPGIMVGNIHEPNWRDCITRDDLSYMFCEWERPEC